MEITFRLTCSKLYGKSVWHQICRRCIRQEEILTHCFAECANHKFVLAKLTHFINSATILNTNSNVSLANLIIGDLSSPTTTSAPKHKLTRALFSTAIYFIWLARCKVHYERVFKAQLQHGKNICTHLQHHQT